MTRSIPYQPVFFVLFRLFHALLSLHTVASQLRAVFAQVPAARPPHSQFEDRVATLAAREEAKVVLSNWSSLQQSPLFRPLGPLLSQAKAPLSEAFVNIACDLIEQQAQAYARSFAHSVGFAGLLGFAEYLRSFPESSALPSFRACVQTLRGACHFETLFQAANLALCDVATELVGKAGASFGHAERRLQHKAEYIPKMREFAAALRAVADPQLHLEIPAILALLRDAAALYQRTRGTGLLPRRQHVAAGVSLLRLHRGKRLDR